MRVRLKYLWSNRHRMTFMPGIGEFFHETDFFQIIRYLHFFDERNAPNRDTTPNYDIYYKVHTVTYTCSKKISEYKKIYFLAKISYIFYLLIFLKAVCCSRVISNLALHFGLFFYN